MRDRAPIELEACRVRGGEYGTTRADGLKGAFLVFGPNRRMMKVLSSGAEDNAGWEHVSVSVQDRTPTWDEMCAIKDLFWGEEECVMQLHPPRSEYVNHHPYCLHLWRPTGTVIPMPPSIFVGPVDQK